MQKFRQLLKKFKVTVMVIPSADHNIKQKNINLAYVLALLIVLIVINVALIATSMTSRIKSVALKIENEQLISDITKSQDNITSLESQNATNIDEIDLLKSTLQNSVDYLDVKLAEIEEADTRIETLVALFNSETDSNIAIPVSRSYNRDNFTLTDELQKSNEAIFTEIESLIQNEEISVIIQSKTDAYDELIAELESQLVYLECRPDFIPTSGTITSKFGYRKDPVTGATAKHNGLDFANVKGTPIYAAGTGIVTFSGYNGSFGNVIIIDHGYSYSTVYGHCTELLVEEGTQVLKGQEIALMGSTGKSTGNHLHFEIRYNDNPINPITVLNFN